MSVNELKLPDEKSDWHDVKSLDLTKKKLIRGDKKFTLTI